jgi:hypothetical protein
VKNIHKILRFTYIAVTYSWFYSLRKYNGSIVLKSKIFFTLVISLAIALCSVERSIGQTEANTTSLPDIIILAEGAGFIPFNQSYRINYQTSLAGIPMEVAGGLCFPVNSSLSALFEVRYKRRTAIFVPDFRIKTLEIELGVRDYLEKEREKDLRLYGSAGLLLVKSDAEGTIDATSDGTAPTPLEVSKSYYNIGLGLGLGVEYPLTSVSGLYAGFHIAIYFADPSGSGGLGNIGGLSIGLGYRINL